MNLNRVDQILLVWNESREVIARYVDAMRRNLGRDWSGTCVIVWNAGSRATLHDAIQAVQSAWRRAGLRILPLPRNVGFGRAVNLGMSFSNREFVAVFNPDGAVDPGCVAQLVDALDDDPSRIAASANMDVGGRGSPAGSKAVVAVGYLPGGASVFRRRAFMDVGGYDPLYFLYGEDNDLAKRSTDYRWNLCMVPGAVFDHRPRLSGRGETLMRQVHKSCAWSRFQLLHAESLTSGVVHAVLGTVRRSIEVAKSGWVAGAAGVAVGGIIALLDVGRAKRRRIKAWSGTSLQKWLQARGEWRRCRVQIPSQGL